MQLPKRKPGKYSDKEVDYNVTAAKLQQLKDQLTRLKQRTPSLAAEVNRLAQLGDFSENAEYQNAKGRLRGTNQRILELEEQIKNAVLIKPTSSDSVQIGSSVTVKIDGKKNVYQILGACETEPSKGIISHASPLGRALMGKKVGEQFTISIAGEEVDCKVGSITYEK